MYFSSLKSGMGGLLLSIPEPCLVGRSFDNINQLMSRGGSLSIFNYLPEFLSWEF